MLLKELEDKLDDYYTHQELTDALDWLDTLKKEYHALFDTSGAIIYDGMPHGKNIGNQPLDAVCQMEDIPEQYRSEIAHQYTFILEIHQGYKIIKAALETLLPVERKIICLKHSKEMNFKQIAKKLHYSESWIKQRYFAILHNILHVVDETKINTKKY